MLAEPVTQCLSHDRQERLAAHAECRRKRCCGVQLFLAISEVARLQVAGEIEHCQSYSGIRPTMLFFVRGIPRIRRPRGPQQVSCLLCSRRVGHAATVAALAEARQPPLHRLQQLITVHWSPRSERPIRVGHEPQLQNAVLAKERLGCCGRRERPPSHALL